MFKNYSHLIFIFIFSVIICGLEFFFKQGTYFLLDTLFFPIDSLKSGFFSTGIFFVLSDIFNIIFGYVIFSKIFFFLIVFFSGLLGYIFSNYLLEFSKVSLKQFNYISYFGIIFMMLNPFFYERMITQPGIFLAFLFLGYSIYFLLKSKYDTRFLNYFLFGLFSGLSISISQHIIFMLLVIVIFYIIIYVRNKKEFLSLVYSGIIVIILNLNWLIGGFFLGNSYAVNSVLSFNQANIDNFLTNSLPGFSVYITNFLLYGFWGERYNYFYLPTQTNPTFFISGIFILFIILLGAIKFFQNNKKLFIFLISLSIISFILGIGLNSNIFGFISRFLYENVPFYIGLREPQKWIGILMISYLLFFINGMIWICTFLSNELGILKSKFSIFILIFITFLFINSWSPNVIYSFKGQLFISDYPKSYFDFKEKYKNLVGKSVVFPWHSYIGCDYTRGRIVANIMGEFLKPMDTIVSDNIEIGTLYSNSTSQTSKDIEEYLKTKDYSLLKESNINNIIFLSKCGDFKNYEFLETDKNILKIYDSDDLKFYQIK